MLQVGKNFYVVCEERTIECGIDCQKCFEVLFKIFYVLNLKFSDRLIGFFNFFQNFVFQVDCRLYTRVEAFFKHLNNQ
jgi:hypothetical protein